MIKKFNHIAVAVSNLDESADTYIKLFNKEPIMRKSVPEQGVNIAIFDINGILFELIEPIDLNNPIARFIDSRGNALHHIAFSVDNIEKAMKKFIENDFKLIGDKPRIGAEGKPIVFFHPKTTDGILIELVEEKE